MRKTFYINLALWLIEQIKKWLTEEYNDNRQHVNTTPEQRLKLDTRYANSEASLIGLKQDLERIKTKHLYGR